jgi:hypothetical protein
MDMLSIPSDHAHTHVSTDMFAYIQAEKAHESYVQWCQSNGKQSPLKLLIGFGLGFVEDSETARFPGKHQKLRRKPFISGNNQIFFIN